MCFSRDIDWLEVGFWLYHVSTATSILITFPVADVHSWYMFLMTGMQ